MGKPPDISQRSVVPLFPLPNVVLFPQAILPLHIFEERYKSMVADSLTGERQIAMALLRAGWEKDYYGHPPVDPVVCVGRIVAQERLADGKYNLLLQGNTRATIVREVPCNVAYRLAEVTPVVEAPVMEIDLAPERQRLVSMFAEGPLAATGIGRKFAEILNGPLSTADAADLISFNFLDDAALKQSLLGDGDVRHRVGRLIEAMEAVRDGLAGSTKRRHEKPSMN